MKKLPNILQKDQIKEIIDLLNEVYPTEHPPKKFTAYLPIENEVNSWHIVCTDYFLLRDEYFKEACKMIHERYEFKIVFVFLYCISLSMMIKNKEREFVL